MAHDDDYPVIVGRYAVYDALASGGMATVHLGRLVGPVGFSRTVAIKRLRADYLTDPEFISMFSDEARLAGRIRHPNVVPVIDVIAADKELLLVMEYVEGETLARLIPLAEEDGRGIPPAIGAAIMRDALAGLHAAHETKDESGRPLDIIHRDVSPQNVIVGVDGVARVLDFGIAKAAGRAQVTRDGSIKGKLAYMSPEQLNGEVSRVTDIFAASVVLWEVLTGQRLFRGETDAETVMKVLAAPIRKPSEARPSLGTAYDAVVMKGLSRDASNTFATAREMAAALAQAGELADAAAIGEWVAEVARDRLVERHRVVSDIESGASHPRLGAQRGGAATALAEAPVRAAAAEAGPPSPLPASASASASASRRRGSFLALGGGVILLAIGLALTVRGLRAETAATTVASVASTTTTSPASAAAPGAAASSAEAAASPSTSASASASASGAASAADVRPAASTTATLAGTTRPRPQPAHAAAPPAAAKSSLPRIPDHL